MEWNESELEPLPAGDAARKPARTIPHRNLSVTDSVTSSTFIQPQRQLCSLHKVLLIAGLALTPIAMATQQGQRGLRGEQMAGLAPQTCGSMVGERSSMEWRALCLEGGGTL